VDRSAPSLADCAGLYSSSGEGREKIGLEEVMSGDPQAQSIRRRTAIGLMRRDWWACKGQIRRD
jgi:hypothetical protein